MISLQTIPHAEQRYNTAGNYLRNGKDYSILVSACGDWKMEALLMIHELVELFLIRERGISIRDVDKFDLAHPELDDPGNDIRAPYHMQHMEATRIEKMMARYLRVSWKKYNQKLDKLWKDYEKSK